MSRADEPVYPHWDGPSGHCFNGMTVREAFVMAAMQGLCSLEGVHEETSDDVAGKAIIIADATLSAMEAEHGV